MAEINGGNWAWLDPGDDIQNGDVINAGNFAQAVADTVILAGKSLTINGGNFTNVRQDAAWTVNGGNWTQVSLCKHLHPDLPLADEVDACPHVTETHNVYIDGVLVQTDYDREDEII